MLLTTRRLPLPFVTVMSVAAVCIVFRRNTSIACDKEEEMNEAGTLKANDNCDVTASLRSERGTGVEDEQLREKENGSLQVNNNPVLSASEASQCTDQQRDSSETQSSDVDGICAGIDSQHTNSTVSNNQKSCEQHLPRFSDESVSTAVTSHCRTSNDESCTNSSSKCASVSAELRVSKSSSSTVRQSSVDLLPKPAFTLLPVGVGVPLLVVVNASIVQSSVSRAMLPTIAPRPADVASSKTCVPTASHEVSSVLGHSDSLNGDIMLHRKQQKFVASVVTQTSSLTPRTRCKTAAAATQTSECFAPASRRSKESRASQVVHV